MKQFDAEKCIKIDHHDLLFNHNETLNKISNYCNINKKTNTNKNIDMSLYRNRH